MHRCRNKNTREDTRKLDMKQLIVFAFLVCILIGCNYQNTPDSIIPSPSDTIDSSLIKTIILRPFQNEQVQNFEMHSIPNYNNGMMFVYQLDSLNGKAIGLLAGSTVLGEFSIHSQSLDILSPHQLYGSYFSNDVGHLSYIGYVYIQHTDKIKQIRIALSDGKTLIIDGNTIVGFIIPKNNPPLRLEVIDTNDTIIEQNSIILPS